MLQDEQLQTFERAVLPHLDAGYNLARWLMRNEQDAQDAAQEAYLRAFRFFPGFLRSSCLSLDLAAYESRDGPAGSDEEGEH